MSRLSLTVSLRWNFNIGRDDDTLEEEEEAAEGLEEFFFGLFFFFLIWNLFIYFFFRFFFFFSSRGIILPFDLVVVFFGYYLDISLVWFRLDGSSFLAAVFGQILPIGSRSNKNIIIANGLLLLLAISIR